MVEEVTKALCELADIMRQEKVAKKSYVGDQWEKEIAPLMAKKNEAANRFIEALDKYADMLAGA